MAKPMRETDQFYWVETNGYHQQYTPLYFNKAKQWRVEINDKTVFISEYKLELLFGRGCVKRPVDFEADKATFEEVKNQNGFFPYICDTEDGKPTILMFNNALQVAKINGMLAPMPLTDKLVFIC